jgi:hypothetical protein
MSTDLLAALAASIEAARAAQRKRDDQPCPLCGGDRLRPNYTPGSTCHVTKEN